MKRALISDIHGNLEALLAVKADIAAQGIDEVYCLGDIVGYGPKPAECIDLVRSFCSVVVQGNHDYAVVDPNYMFVRGFNPVAVRALNWTTSVLGEEQRRWLGALSPKYTEGDVTYCHASPRDPLNEYLFPHDCHNTRKMEECFAHVERWAYNGHTHTPGVLAKVGDAYDFLHSTEIENGFELDKDVGEECKCIINVGSVGQPRDNNRDACYLILNHTTITYRRVSYPVEVTAALIRQNPDLDDRLAERLEDGM